MDPRGRTMVGLPVSVSFVVYGTAQTAGSKRGFYNAKAGRVIVTDANERSRPWKALVSDAALQAMLGAGDDGSRILEVRAPLEGPLLLELTFWIARPKSHLGSGKNGAIVRPGAPHAPAVKPDLLKLARAVEDALTGIVYRDDAQITAETLQKAYTTGQARTEIRVVPVADPREHREDACKPAGAVT